MLGLSLARVSDLVFVLRRGALLVYSLTTFGLSLALLRLSDVFESFERSWWLLA